MTAVTISPKYQIVIPKDIRERFNLKPGQKVQMVEVDGCIELVPVLPIEDLRGIINHVTAEFEREPDRVLD